MHRREAHVTSLAIGSLQAFATPIERATTVATASFVVLAKLIALVPEHGSLTFIAMIARVTVAALATSVSQATSMAAAGRVPMAFFFALLAVSRGGAGKTVRPCESLLTHTLSLGVTPSVSVAVRRRVTNHRAL
eukprot:840789-Rhodomonas_salina.1